MNKQERNQALVEEKLKEAQEAFIRNHTAKVEIKYGNTYIEYFDNDTMVRSCLQRIALLLNLMGVNEYSHECYAISEKRAGIMIPGEDENRAAFIRRFIENGYVLS